VKVLYTMYDIHSRLWLVNSNFVGYKPHEHPIFLLVSSHHIGVHGILIFFSIRLPLNSHDSWLRSGKLTYGKSPSLIGKSTISMGHGFNSYVTNYQRVFPMNLPINPIFIGGMFTIQ
jgi:hypothetical protein